MALPVEDQEKVLKAFDVLFVPGMAFHEKSGKRLGFGSGYYDKFLSGLKEINADVPIIGLGFDFQVFWEGIPYNERDAWVDYIITPKRTIKVGIEWIH